MSNLEEVKNVLTKYQFIENYESFCKANNKATKPYKTGFLIKNYGILKLGIQYQWCSSHIGIFTTALSGGWIGHWHGLPKSFLSWLSHEPLTEDVVLNWVENELKDKGFEYQSVSAVQEQLF